MFLTSDSFIANAMPDKQITLFSITYVSGVIVVNSNCKDFRQNILFSNENFMLPDDGFGQISS